MSVTSRAPTYPVAPQFIERWSPRAFTGESIPEATLLGFIEAARWAPSAYNSQPWRFLYARRDSADWQRYLDLLIDFNRGWAQHASALLLIVSKTTFVPPGKSEEQPAPSHTFGPGAFQVRLTVLDAAQQSGQDSAVIIVAAGENWPPVDCTTMRSMSKLSLW